MNTVMVNFKMLAVFNIAIKSGTDEQLQEN